MRTLLNRFQFTAEDNRIIGTIKSIDRITETVGDNETDSLIVTIHDEMRGMIKFRCPSNLERTLTDNSAAVGETMEIVYTGEVKTRQGYSIKTFDVYRHE